MSENPKDYNIYPELIQAFQAICDKYGVLINSVSVDWRDMRTMNEPNKCSISNLDVRTTWVPNLYE